MNYNKLFLILFVCISILHLAGQLLVVPGITIFTKPLIIPFLLFFLVSRKSDISMTRGFRFFMVTALVFSYLGDVLLMFADRQETFFLLGLGAFLLAHLAYIKAFLSKMDGEKIKFRPHPVISIMALLYLGVMIYMLFPKLDLVMRIAVAAYGMVISTMLVVATGLRHVLNSVSYGFLISGAILFVISDSMIAFNKFLIPIPLSGFWIMLTYILAQYLIISNIVIRKDELS